ncbi:hypothetical protein GCM10007161_03760 [Ignatzschineria indica]|uniref:Uncharacterized protein n=1 Tax=Ignatzschineria indica TaxID=472583 RepID=A0A2U2AMK7_9GAMM|nr:DUF262 domain-containing protein [Ignatzschineria indica]PWD84377.1 hypothetical protein DC082_02210 [Ignatzschineria indica]GGZ75989.1 hypothetical protein GCM10007161_03760 [Ignatzschineria indica]
MSNKAMTHTICPIQELLKEQNLRIPQYQRPYKWTAENVSALLHDIKTQSDRAVPYRLGSIVFHRQIETNEDGTEKMILNIVDGQQRIMTLMLIIWALRKHYVGDEKSSEDRESRKDEIKSETVILRSDLVETLKELTEKASFQDWAFPSTISQENITQNYQLINHYIAQGGLQEKEIDFLLNRCQVVRFELQDISEAFQFFDSQNSRGRDLAPHDLLKAFHLREFPDSEVNLKPISIAYWEATEDAESDELRTLFGTYLFRIRRWMQQAPARYFTKSQIALFKGINLDHKSNYPYTKALQVTHRYIDHYNRQFDREIDGQKMDFPFQLDQAIINGRRFFEMVEYYQKSIVSPVIQSQFNITTSDEEKHNLSLDGLLSDRAVDILQTLATYGQRHRVGDGWVRMIFDCALITYLDKFGPAKISEAIEQIFIWAYACRLQQHAVQLATVDNYVLGRNLFAFIKEANEPQEVFIQLEKTRYLPTISGNHSDIVGLFEKLGFYKKENNDEQ